MVTGKTIFYTHQTYNYNIHSIKTLCKQKNIYSTIKYTIYLEDNY